MYVPSAIYADLSDLLLSLQPFYVYVMRIYKDFDREFFSKLKANETKEIKTMNVVIGKKKRNSLGYKIRQSVRYFFFVRYDYYYCYYYYSL